MSARREKRRDRNGIEKWYWIVDFTYRHPDGRHERVRRYSPVNNKRGAEMYERELREMLLGSNQADEEEEEESPREIPRLKTFAGDFMASYAKANNKASELKSKQISLDSHLLPAFGKKRLDQITVRDVESYKAGKMADGYKPKTINNHLGVLRKLLKTAVEWEIINVVPLIRPLKAQKPVVRFLDFHESQELLQQAEPRWKAMVNTALNTGMRLGELLALRWANVDLERRQVVVCENDWRGIISSPKGHKARVVPLNDRVHAALSKHKHRLGPLVFCRPDGRRLSYQECRRPLLRACHKAGICEPVQWHALRHTFASQLVMRGVPLRAVQELLGHATIDMTMRYAHLTPDARHAAVRVLDDTHTSAARHGTLMAHQNRVSEKLNNIA